MNAQGLLFLSELTDEEIGYPFVVSSLFIRLSDP